MDTRSLQSPRRCNEEQRGCCVGGFDEISGELYDLRPAPRGRHGQPRSEERLSRTAL